MNLYAPGIKKPLTLTVKGYITNTMNNTNFCREGTKERE